VSDKLNCAAEGCDRPVVRRPGARGRPPIYCSPPCRPSYSRPPISIEVDKDDDSDIEQGREWTVRLRRGERVLVVRSGLGRFSASAFASELSGLVNPGVIGHDDDRLPHPCDEAAGVATGAPSCPLDGGALVRGLSRGGRP
jgi:hypothetical protein